MSRIFIFLSILVITIFSTTLAFAQSPDERLQQIEQQKADLQDKIAKAQSSIKTFSGQIALMDNQIKLTSLKISQTEAKIVILESDVDVLSRKIGRVEDSLSLLQQTLVERIRTSYVLGKPTTGDMLLSEGTLSDELLNYQYLQALERNDMKLLSQMQSTKQNYGDQKISLENKQKELEAAKKDLDDQNNQLAQQKKDKEVLLTTTRNDEKRYQQIFAQLQSEARAIQEAIASSVNLKNGVHVSKGEAIALMGNTGSPSCSTGAHLHFEVRDNGVLKDPQGYLKSVGLSYLDDHTGRINPSGSWDWPLPSPVITQEFGMSYWARLGFYGGGPHTGIDMISQESITIRAVADGMLYRSQTTCGSSTLKYAVLDHGNGIRTYYLHIQ